MPTTTATRTRTPTEVRAATAWLHVVARHGRTVVAGSRSGLPLGLRQLRSAPGDTALRVGLVQTGAMLVGGDDVHLDVDVGAGASLILRDISATLAHPVADGAPAARQHLRIRVADGGRAVIAEEPLVVAAGARLHRDVRIDLHGEARLLHRDTLVLGRYGEDGGTLVARTRAVRDGAPVLDDTLDTSIEGPALRSAAVLGSARVLASLTAFGTDLTDALPADGFALSPVDTLVRRLAAGVRELQDLNTLQRAWQATVLG
ncbi:MAG TPA: urease accessory protein UreD [Baekduia sp.]|jgi:urease accessory protein